MKLLPVLYATTYCVVGVYTMYLFYPTGLSFWDMVRIYFIVTRVLIMTVRAFNGPFAKANMVLGHLWQDVVLFEYIVFGKFFKAMF